MSSTVISLIVYGLFALILIVGFLIGLWRGLKKSLLNTVLSIVFVLLAFFLTPVITNAIMGMKVDGTQTLNEMLIGQLLADPSIGSLLSTSPALESLVIALPTALANSILFIIITIVFEMVMYVIYKTIALIFFRNKKKKLAEGEKPPKKHRLWGGLVGALKAGVIAIFVLMPISALSGLFIELNSKEDYFLAPTEVTAVSVQAEDNSEQSMIEQYIPQVAIDVVYAFKNSPFGWVGGLFGMDNMAFDYLTKVEVDGQPVAVRQEISSIWKLFQAYEQIGLVGTDENKTYATLNYDKLKVAVDGVLDGGLYNTVVVDFAQNFIVNYDTLDWFNPQELGDLEGILAQLKEQLSKDGAPKVGEFLKADIKSLLDLLEYLGESGTIDNIKAYMSEHSGEESLDFLELIKVINQKEGTLKTTIQDLFNLKTIRFGAKTIADLVVGFISQDGADKSGANIPVILNPSDPAYQAAEERWNAAVEGLSNALDNVLTLLGTENFDINSLFSEDGDILSLIEKELDLDTIFTSLGNAVDSLANNELFVTTSGDNIIQKILGDVGLTLPKDDNIWGNYPGENQENIENKTESVEWKEVGENEGIIIAGQEQPIVVDNYSTLFSKVLLPSMKLIKSSNIYDILKDGGSINPQTLLKFVAQKSKPGDESTTYGRTYLAQVLLPLYQIEPTRSMFVDDIMTALTTDQFSLAQFKEVKDLDSEFAYISDLLVALYDAKAEGAAIDEIFSGEGENKLEGLIKELEQGQLNATQKYLTGGTLSKIIEPILRAKSTSTMTTELFNSIKTALDTLIGEESDVSLSWNNQVGQISEVLDVFENFLPLLKKDSFSFESLLTSEDTNGDVEMIGHILNAMKINRYSSESGVFADSFDKLVAYLEKTLGTSLKEGNDYSQVEDFTAKINSAIESYKQKIPGA